MSDLPILNSQPAKNSVVESLSETVQVRGTNTMSRLYPVHYMARAGYLVSPWWSPTRDVQLRRFWKTSDHLSGAVFTMQSRMTAIPFKIVPRDPSVKRHIHEAELMTSLIFDGAEFGESWISFYGKFIEDLLTQDNGAFAEVIGQGPITGPIIGRPLGVAHLDSYRCQRTGNPEFPVLYEDLEGRLHKLHYSRVMFTSQMSSPIEEMFGVGFSAVSRCINVSQTLVDILQFKQEKLGSRPHRAIIITRGGLDPSDIQSAFQMAEERMDNQGLSRYSKIVVAGQSSLQDADVKLVELSQLPDGFDEATSISLGMATIALAFGVDARELFPAMSAGSTRADALLQHLKQRGKGPGQIIQTTEHLFNFKFLPPYLKFVFDFQDDAQDRQAAEIHKIRAERSSLLLSAGLVTANVVRKKMLVDGEIDQIQFEQLELEDGRLPDGSSVLSLFYSTNPDYSRLLRLGVSDPLDIEANDAEDMKKRIQKRIRKVMAEHINAMSTPDSWITLKALSALTYLERAYTGTVSVDGTIEPGYIRPIETIDLTAPNMATELDEDTDLNDASEL